MLSRQVNTALGAAVIAAAGLTAFALTASAGSESTPVVSQSVSQEPDPQPSTKPAMRAQPEEDGAVGCVKGQHSGTLIGQPEPGYIDGPDSPRTPEDAIAESDSSLGIRDAKSGRYREDVTYAQKGKSVRLADGNESRKYVGRKANGKPRAIHKVAGGKSGGGFVVISSTVCADPPK